MNIALRAPVMPWARPATDWAARGLTTAARSASLLTGEAWLFSFESRMAQVRCGFAFIGGGVGIGESWIPYDFALPGNAARLNCRHVFTAADLDRAFGMVISAGVNDPMIRLNKGTLRITAFDFSFKPYFEYQPVPGPDLVPGIGASWVEGRWRLVALFDKATGKTWSNAQLNAQRSKTRR